MYNGNRDLVSMKSWLLSLLPSPVISLNGDQFREQILNKRFVTPWLVEFYASWCGHCTHFEPEFRKVAHVTNIDQIVLHFHQKKSLFRDWKVK